MALTSANKDCIKPQNLEEFKAWFETKFGYNSRNYVNYYSAATQLLHKSFISSSFWESVRKELPNINDTYKIQKGYQLLTKIEPPEIYIKSLDSLLTKAYRKNILNNAQFPEPPIGGWVTPDNWFVDINDILRTTIVVKYLDGVEFLLQQLAQIAIDCSCKLEYSLEAREEGYYAAHGGVKISLDLIKENFQPSAQVLNIEIQVTTELQEIIKTLLHKHYEKNRKSVKPKNYKWQWDYQCDEFSSNYLGHIVHYVEGMIVEIRDKQNCDIKK
jgi:ppGpp synthetase/RelA/SpoT-type nucleotidyltranferase